MHVLSFIVKMNGDTNGIVGEPVNSAVKHDVDTVPESKNLTAVSLADEFGGNIVMPEHNADNQADPINVKKYNNDVQESTQDEKNIIIDDLKVLEDNAQTAPDLLNNSNDRRELQGIVASNSNNFLKDLHDDKINYYEYTLKSSQEVNIKHLNDEILEESGQGKGINESEFNHNSVDGPSEHDEDTLGDTMSSGDVGVERLQNLMHKFNNGDTKTGTFKIVTFKRHHSDDDNSSTYSGPEEEPKLEDIVSGHSNSDTLAKIGENSFENDELSKSNEVIRIENDVTDNYNGIRKTYGIYNFSDTSDNDDCAVTAVEKINKKSNLKRSKANNTNVELRRSNREIKLKKYDNDEPHLDDGSDIEEVVMEDPLNSKTKQIVIDNTKTFMEITPIKPKAIQNKVTGAVIIDSPVTPKTFTPPVTKSTSNALNKYTHEIYNYEFSSDISDNDDCVVTAVEKINKKSNLKRRKRSKANNTNVELRRSNRKIKLKKYNNDEPHLDDGSDIEEVVMEDPLNSKTKQIVVDNTKTFMEITPIKPKAIQNKVTGAVIIDSPVTPKTFTPPVTKSTSNALNKNIYQRIASRGISVTPVTTKNMTTQTTQVNMTTSARILPTLTDEMFVVEAPSFIVPYVYEKPAIIPFKEFLNKWGKEIEEEKAKEDQLLLEKKKNEKIKKLLEKQVNKDTGEEVRESDEEVNSEVVKKKKAEKAEKKERRHRHRGDDDESWDGSSSEESEDDTISDEDGHTSIKDEINIINESKDVKVPTAGPTTKCENYFDLCLGKFFMNIGLNLVQEYVQTDLLNQQNRKLQREKKAGHDTKNRQISIALLTNNLKLSQKNNKSLSFDQKKCKFCTFKTESALAMAHHLETPHMKNNLYTCNYCVFAIRSPHDILFHMEKEHSVKGKLERTPALHQCTNCPFEDHGKGKLARHLTACAKKFKPETNLAPPVEWEHPAKIAKLSRARNNLTPYQASQFGRHHVDSVSVRIPIGNAGVTAALARARQPPAVPAALAPPRPSALQIRHASPALNYPTANTKKQMNHSISITALPRQSGPMQPLHSTNAKGFVMCEICDGYIKDLEQLRNHMQWIHKVKIHPKMIYNRPPLNCQKCQFRFFTDQGLERHLLGSHGLVTSAIQEAANRGKDAGRCPVCGRVYQWKLLGHVSRDHNLVLKPAHLSYKCTVCTATFGMYRQFESHVYSAHSVVAKKVMDKKASAASSKAIANDNAAKQLKINDEITITPQPVKAPESSKGK